MLLNEIETINYVGKDDLFLRIQNDWQYQRSQEPTNVKTEGKFGKFEIKSIEFKSYSQLNRTYMVFDPSTKRYIAGLEISSFGRNQRSWQVDRVGVASAYQGMNLSVKLYEWCIKQKNLILMTGFSQSTGGRSIWERLAKVPNVFIFGYDVDKKESFQVDQNDLFNEDVYDDVVAQDEDDAAEELAAIRSYIDPSTPEYDKEKEKISKKNDQATKATERAKNYLRLVAIKSKK